MSIRCDGCNDPDPDIDTHLCADCAADRLCDPVALKDQEAELKSMRQRLTAAEKALAHRDEFFCADHGRNACAECIDLYRKTEAKLSLYESAPSEPGVAEALATLDNLTTNHPVPMIAASHAKHLAHALKSCQAKLAEATNISIYHQTQCLAEKNQLIDDLERERQNTRIADTVEQISGPDVASYTKAVLQAVDRAEKAESELAAARAKIEEARKAAGEGK